MRIFSNQTEKSNQRLDNMPEVRKRPFAATVPASALLPKVVTQYREKALQEQAQLPELKERAAQLDVDIAACTGRMAMHRKTQLQQEREMVLLRIKDLEGGHEISRLEELASKANDALNRGVHNEDMLVDEFQALVENRNPTIVPITQDVCRTCKLPMKLTQESRMACPKCGASVLYLDATSFSMAYGDEVEFTKFTYRRENHFQECMNQFQAKQTTELSNAMLMQVLLVLQEQHHVAKPEDIKISMMRPTLKELDKRKRAGTLAAGMNFRKLYEHYMLIYTRLSGKPPPRLTPEQECNMKMLFRAIQMPFEKHRPADRTNFLSYNYCLFKFCQLLGYDNFLCYFPLLKCDDKLLKCDDTMKKIFKDLGWTWTPTHRQSGTTRTTTVVVPSFLQKK